MQSNNYVAISGATGGLGAFVALTLASHGKALLLGGRDFDKLEKLKEQISVSFRTPVTVAHLDVCEPSSVESFFSVLSGKLVGYVHTAAILGAVGPTSETDPAEWKTTIETNLIGTYLCLRAAAVKMQFHGEGSIVALSGGGASGPLKTLSAYAASKVAVVRLVETMAEELKDEDIRINAVAPGVLPTQMNLSLLNTSRGSSIDKDYLEEIKSKLRDAEGALQNAADLISFLLDSDMEGLSGRLISAAWDNWREWDTNPPDFESKDLFRLRRQIDL